MIFTLSLMALALIITAAYFDYTQMRLPNILVLGVMVLFIEALLAQSFSQEAHATFEYHISSHLYAAGVVFIITGILFAINVLGAGDAKMATVIALWLGLHGLPTFLMVMSLVGFGLALMAYIFQKADKKYGLFSKLPYPLRPYNGWLHRLHKGENAIPYGIALACGAFVAFGEIGYLTMPQF